MNENILLISLLIIQKNWHYQIKNPHGGPYPSIMGFKEDFHPSKK